MPKTIARILTPQSVVIFSAAIAICAVLTAVVFASRTPAASHETAELGTVTQEIDSTGQIKAADSLSLSFDVGGRIGSIPAKVGQHVVVGQLLAALSALDIAANVSQARANLEMQTAKLAGIKAGARAEDIAVSETSVTGAQNALDQATQSLLSAAQDAYVKSDDAVHNKVDLFLDNPRSPQPHLSLQLSDQQLANNIVQGRVQMETLLSDWKNYLDSVPAETVDAATLAAKTRANVTAVASYLSTVSSGLSSAISSTYTTATTIQGYQTSVSTGRTNISTSLSAFNTAVSAQQAAQSALATAKSQYTLKTAGAQDTDIQAQEAVVASAQAALELAQAQLAKTAIRSPIAGTVTKNEAHLGETAAAGHALITVDSDAAYQVETYISEADVPFVTVGQNAEVRLDAYPDSEPVPAKVITVDPSATIQNGISSYKVTLQLLNNDERVKSGLTVNVRIVSAEKDSVLTVPTSAIITRGSEQYVLREKAGGDEIVPVKIGIHSRDGKTEIVSGLMPGDRIRSFGNQ